MDFPMRSKRFFNKQMGLSMEEQGSHEFQFSLTIIYSYTLLSKITWISEGTPWNY